MDEELFEEDASGFGEGNDAVEETTVEEAPAESGYEASETFENVPEETAPTTEPTYITTESTNTTSESESSPYEWITADWNTAQTTPTTELSQQLESTDMSNAASGNEPAQSTSDLLGGSFKSVQEVGTPKKVSDGKTESRDEVISRLTNEVNDIISKFPNFDQPERFGIQLQEVPPTNDQLNAAKEKGFNKDYYDYAAANTTPIQQRTSYGSDPGYVYNWGTYNNELVPLADAGYELRSMKRAAERGNESKYNASKENFYKSIEKFQELKAYTSVWNEDGTLAPTSDEKLQSLQKVGDIWIQNRSKIADAMKDFIDNPSKDTLNAVNTASRGQVDKNFQNADSALAEMMKSKDSEISEYANNIFEKSPLNEELLSAYENAYNSYIESINSEKEKAKIEKERAEAKLSKEKEAASSMSKDELITALSKGEISMDVYNGRIKEIEKKEADEFKNVLDKGVENFTAQELIDYRNQLVSGPDAKMSPDEWRGLYDAAYKKEGIERSERSREMRDKAVAMLSDEDKTNDLSALNILNKASEESGTMDFSAKGTEVTYTNPTTGEIEKKSPEEFLQEVLDPESEFNKSENWSQAVSTAVQAARDAGLTGNAFLDYLSKVDPVLAQFLRAVFVDDWDNSNTLSKQQYIEATNKLKGTLDKIWNDNDKSWISKVWDSIKTIVSGAKEYKEITKETQIYRLIKSAQTLVTRGFAVAVSIASGMPFAAAALYVASVGKGVISDRLKKMGYESASNIMDVDLGERSESMKNEATTSSVTGRMISKAGAEPATVDYKGYNKGLEEKEVARKDVPSDIILKVFKKEPKTFAWIRNV